MVAFKEKLQEESVKKQMSMVSVSILTSESQSEITSGLLVLFFSLVSCNIQSSFRISITLKVWGHHITSKVDFLSEGNTLDTANRSHKRSKPRGSIFIQRANHHGNST